MSVYLTNGTELACGNLLLVNNPGEDVLVVVSSLAGATGTVRLQVIPVTQATMIPTTTTSSLAPRVSMLDDNSALVDGSNQLVLSQESDLDIAETSCFPDPSADEIFLLPFEGRLRVVLSLVGVNDDDFQMSVFLDNGTEIACGNLLLVPNPGEDVFVVISAGNGAAGPLRLQVIPVNTVPQTTATTTIPTTACSLQGCAQCKSKTKCQVCQDGFAFSRSGVCGLDCRVEGCKFCFSSGKACKRCDDGLVPSFDAQICEVLPGEAL